MDMNVDLELETKISRRELRVLLLHEFRLGRKATEATSNICGTMGRMYSPSVQRNIGSIGSRTITSNSTIYLPPEDYYK
jgi:hypothetical protein